MDNFKTVKELRQKLQPKLEPDSTKKLEAKPEQKIIVVLGSRMESKQAKPVAEIIKAVQKVRDDLDMNMGQRQQEFINLHKKFSNGTPEQTDALNKIIAKVLTKREYQIKLNDWRWPMIAKDSTNQGLTSQKKGEVAGGETRIITAGILAREYPDAEIVTTGGNETIDGVNFEKAEEMAEQIVAKEGVEASRVTPLINQKVKTTEGDAMLLKEHLDADPEKYKNLSELIIDTNNHHMLRSWLIFSKQFSRELVLFTELKRDIVKLLVDEIVAIHKSPESYSAEKIKETRTKVMELLQGRFHGLKYKITPRTSEDTLEASGDKAKARYARKVKEIPYVKQAVENENIAVIKLLLGVDWIKDKLGKTRLDVPDVIKLSEILNGYDGQNLNEQ